MGFFSRVKYYEVQAKELPDGKWAQVAKTKKPMDQSEVATEAGFQYRCIARLKNGSSKTLWNVREVAVIQQTDTVETERDYAPLFQLNPERQGELMKDMESLADVIETMDKIRDVFTTPLTPQQEAPAEGQAMVPMNPAIPIQQSYAIPPPKFGDVEFPWYAHPYGAQFLTHTIREFKDVASEIVADVINKVMGSGEESIAIKGLGELLEE